MDPYDFDSSDEFPSQSTIPETPLSNYSISFNGITWWAGMSGIDDFPALFQYVVRGHGTVRA
jgi:hypothetical protein